MIVQNNIGAMVEVNCETDFVARNKQFQQFVESVSIACVQHVSKMPTTDVFSKVCSHLLLKKKTFASIFCHLTQVYFEAENLKAMIGQDGRSLADELALMIGNVGENATLRRATCFKASDPITLFGLTHPTQAATTSTNVHLGKYGSIVAYKTTGDVSGKIDLHKNICQHIIGMNPAKVGRADIDKPNDNKDDENCLIYQEYLLDPSVTVGELFAENSLEIVGFNRFECGENVVTSEESLNLAKASN